MATAMSGSLDRVMISTPTKQADISLSDELAAFGNLRITALKNAAEISPLVKEVTIGPNSPLNKEKMIKEPEEPNKVDNEPVEDLNEDKLGLDLRYVLKMKEYEAKVHETSEMIFRNLIEKMIAKRAETMRHYWKKQSDECDRRALELQARKYRMLQELQDNDNHSVLERAKLDEQHSKVLNQQTLESMNRILEEQNRATARFASITDSHTKICICYNEINNLVETELGKKVIDKYITPLNSVISNINSILDLCKSGSISDKDVTQAEVLVANIENIRKKLADEINNIIQQKQQAQQKQAEEAERRAVEEQHKALEAKILQEQELMKADEQASTKQPMFYSQKNYCYYEEQKNYLISYEAQYKDLLENAAYKKFRFDCQKAINTPVNAISSVSGHHIRDKYEKLSKFLKGERVQVLDTFVQATQHPQGLAFVTALLAKKIVRQGDLLVSSKPEAAFPLASVTVALWSEFPELGRLLEAYFQKECPYLVPMFLPQKEGQTDKEFYLSRGYTYSEDGVVEKQDKFLKRTSGIFRLMCAIWVSQTPRVVNAVNPHGLSYGWRWLASFINLKPEPDICATLLFDFFTVAGADFLKHYGRQFIKLIKVVAGDYLKILDNIDEGGPKTRLEVFLQNVLKTGHIPPPSGLLAPNTW